MTDHLGIFYLIAFKWCTDDSSPPSQGEGTILYRLVIYHTLAYCKR